MLQFDPQRGIDFIIRFINRCCDAFAHPDNEVEFVEPPFTVKFKLPDGSYSEQYANDRLWAAYRAASVVPDTFASALMALESRLLARIDCGFPGTIVPPQPNGVMVDGRYDRDGQLRNEYQCQFS